MEEMELILDEGEGYLIEFKESMSDSLAKGDLEVAAAGGTVSNIDFRILELIENGEIVRRPDVERLVHLSYATAQRRLANLVKKELMLFEGAPKTGKYVLTRKGAEFLASLKEEGGHR